MINTFEEKLAYEIGVKLAHQDYLKKEASMQAAKTLMGGLKGVATGQGSTMSQAFRQGAKQVEGHGATNFRGVMGEIGQGLKAPWQNMYKTYGARSAQRGIERGKANLATAQKNLDAARKANKGVAEAEKAVDAASQQLRTTGATARQTFGGGATNYQGQMQNLNATASRGYIPRNAVDQKKVKELQEAVTHFKNKPGMEKELAAAQRQLANAQRGTVNYGALGTMATGVGIAGAGTYMAGNAAFGGGNTYVTNQVQPQAAPHEYYLKKFFG